jgi:hypothetical protein
MRIGSELLSVYQNTPSQNHQNLALSAGRAQAHTQSSPGVIVDISPAGWAAYNQAKAAGGKEHADGFSAMECETCDSRAYQDNSDDPSVSFQSPTHINPRQSASVVAAHEAEHIANDRASAEREGREVVSQTVSLITSICPECKLTYVSGGEARTLSMSKGDNVDIEA